MELRHHHLLVSCTFKVTPFKLANYSELWIQGLIDDIDMHPLYGPLAVDCHNEYNTGLSAFAIIETSHISLHSWDHLSPNLVQLDVYSCKEFDKHNILNKLRELNPLTLKYKFLDRSSDFIEVDQFNP